MNFNDERELRAWAIDLVMRSGGSSLASASVDLITAAQRIVDFVKGDGAAQKPGEGA